MIPNSSASGRPSRSHEGHIRCAHVLVVLVAGDQRRRACRSASAGCRPAPPGCTRTIRSKAWRWSSSSAAARAASGTFAASTAWSCRHRAGRLVGVVLGRGGFRIDLLLQQALVRRPAWVAPGSRAAWRRRPSRLPCPPAPRRLRCVPLGSLLRSAPARPGSASRPHPCAGCRASTRLLVARGDALGRERRERGTEQRQHGQQRPGAGAGESGRHQQPTTTGNGQGSPRALHRGKVDRRRRCPERQVQRARIRASLHRQESTMDPILLGKASPTTVARHPLAAPKFGNRHGLVAGATGTGKTVTLMTLAEGFSRMGVPVFLADVKGDVAGLAVAGTGNEKSLQRANGPRRRRLRARRQPGDLLGPVRQAGPSGADHGQRNRPAAAGPHAGTERHPEPACSTSCSSSPTTAACCCWTWTTCAPCSAWSPTNARTSSTEYGLVSTPSIGAIQRSLLRLDARTAAKTSSANRRWNWPT